MKKYIIPLCFLLAFTAGCNKSTEEFSTSEKTPENNASDTEQAEENPLDEKYAEIYRNCVKKQFDRLCETTDGNATVTYTLKDFNKDNIPELILKYGTCEADFMIDIITINSELQPIVLKGEIGGGHTSFACDKNDGNFVLAQGSMGYGAFIWYSVSGETPERVKTYDFEYASYEKYHEFMEQENIEYMSFASTVSFGMNGGIKTYVYNKDTMDIETECEEYDGLYLDFIK